MGAASFAQGAIGAIGAGQQAAAANKQALNNYKYQLQVRERDWKTKLNVWGNERLEYKKNISEGGLAANRSYVAEQDRVNEAVRQALFQDFQARKELNKNMGSVAASGRTGKTAQRLEGDMIRQYGMNNAILAENLVSALTLSPSFLVG